MAQNISTDILIIGAGPGGYVAAIKAAQLGFKVVVVDRRKEAGGTCLNVGCIPSKALLTSSHKYMEARENLEKHGVIVEGLRLNLKAMMSRKEGVVDELTRGISFLFRKNGVTFVQGSAWLVSPGEVRVINDLGEETNYTAKHIILATGSESAILPDVTVDEERIVTSTGALSLKKVPKHIVVIGAGYIGLELGSVWARLGSAVTVVEYLDRLAPTLDREVASALQKALEEQGIVFRFNRKVTQVVEKSRELMLHLHPTDAEADVPELMTCDVVLLAIGRRPATQDMGLENVDIKTDNRGFIQVSPQFETSCKGIYAIGDIIPGPMLAHKAEEEGIAVVEHIAGQAGHVNYDVIPAVVYTSPEVASVGKTEEELKSLNISYNNDC